MAAAINWDKLKHAQGSAKAIPELAKQLTKAKAEAAIDALADALIDAAWRGDKRKALYSASGPALALLADAVVDKKLKHRKQLLDIMVTMLQLGDRHALLATGLDLTDNAIKRRFAGKGHALLAAATESAEAVATLLGDEGTEVRELAAIYLGFVPAAAAASWPLLAKTAEKDNAPEVRARATLAAAYLAKADSEMRKNVVSWLHERDGAAAALGSWLVAGKVSKAAAAQDALMSYLVDSVTFADREPRQSGGVRALDDQALAILGEGVLGDAGQRAALDAILVALPKVGGHTRQRHTWVNFLIRWHFPKKVDPNKLTKSQKEVLHALCDVPHGGVWWDTKGLPMDVRCRRRVLGLDAPTVLEDVVPKKKKPRHAVMRAAMGKWVMLDEDKAPDPQTYLTKYFADLDHHGWLQFWTEVEANAYELGMYSQPEMLKAAYARCSRSEQKAWREHYLAECRAPYNEELYAQLGWALAWAALDGKGKLPASLEDIVHIYGPIDDVRVILEAIPEARRKKIIASCVAALPGNHGRAKRRVHELGELAPGGQAAVQKRFT